MTSLVSLARQSVFAKIWQILGPSDRRGALQVFAGLLIGMVFETLTIGAVIPALTLFSDAQAAVRFSLVADVLNKLGNPSQSTLIVGGLLLILALYGVKSLVLLGLVWQQTRFLSSMRQNISRRLFETYLTQPWTFHLQRNSAQLIRNATTEIAMFANGCQGLLTSAAEACVASGIALLLIWIEPLAACFTGVTLALASWTMQSVLRKRISRWGKMRQRAEGERVQALQQGLGGAKEVKVFGREFDFIEHYRKAELQATHAIRMQSFSAQVPRLWYELLAVAGVAMLGVILVLQGGQPSSVVARLGLFAVAAFRLVPSLYRSVSGLQSLRFLEPVVDMLTAELALPCMPAQANSGLRLTLEQSIRVEKISFTYPSASQATIQNVSMTIPNGTAVGIVGESGAGKSTLIDLLLGLFEPDSGRITADGQDIHLSLRAWQNSIGYVPQTIFLTDDSIRANVAFGVPANEIDDGAVRRSLAAAQLDDFVATLPDGINAIVGERGVRLSGGQRQRIGIARALYWDPPILVLDEATSALDTATESGVMDAVNRLHGAKTLIIIAHRLSTVSRCDEVFRLSRGKLVQPEEVTGS